MWVAEMGAFELELLGCPVHLIDEVLAFLQLGIGMLLGQQTAQVLTQTDGRVVPTGQHQREEEVS